MSLGKVNKEISYLKSSNCSFGALKRKHESPPNQVEPGASGSQPIVPGECSICLRSLQENPPTVVTPCGHEFHRDCLCNWLSERPGRPIRITCPYCRTSLRSVANDLCRGYIPPHSGPAAKTRAISAINAAPGVVGRVIPDDGNW